MKIDLIISPLACLYKYIVIVLVYTGQACVHLLSQIHFVSQVDYQSFSTIEHAKSLLNMVQAMNVLNKNREEMVCHNSFYSWLQLTISLTIFFPYAFGTCTAMDGYTNVFIFFTQIQIFFDSCFL
jgi:hypothetical protein